MFTTQSNGWRTTEQHSDYNIRKMNPVLHDSALHSELPPVHDVYAIPKQYFPFPFILISSIFTTFTVSPFPNSSLGEIFLPRKTSDRLNRGNIYALHSTRLNTRNN